jgi:aryl-alcohol dehydrogenase-like predicted oxidoreductase
MRGLDDLVRAGKVLYVGISDAPAWWIAQANTLAHLRGWSPFIGLQIEYSLIERTFGFDAACITFWRQLRAFSRTLQPLSISPPSLR